MCCLDIPPCVFVLSCVVVALALFYVLFPRLRLRQGFCLFCFVFVGLLGGETRCLKNRPSIRIFATEWWILKALLLLSQELDRALVGSSAKMCALCFEVDVVFAFEFVFLFVFELFFCLLTIAFDF